MGKGTNSAAGLMEEIKMDKQNPEPEPQQGTAESGLTAFDEEVKKAQEREDETGVDQQDGDLNEGTPDDSDMTPPEKSGGSA